MKGIHLEGLRVIGDPGRLARCYHDQGIDGIVYMDIVALLYGRCNIISVVERAAGDVFVPLTVGGGLRSVEDIVVALRAGADKVAINTAAIARPAFLKEAAETFGSQCIVLSVEAKARASGRWEALTDNGRETTGVDLLDWVAQAGQLGVGETLITSVDREGTRKGFDLDLLAAVRRTVGIPVIASGGAGAPEHLVSVLVGDSAHAIACASVFHDEDYDVALLKELVGQAGFEVRQ